MRRLVLLAAIVVARPAAAQIGLTIYNDGRVLVRRTLPVQVPAGVSVQRFSTGALDPGSVFSLDSAIAIMGSSYDAAIDEQSVMRRAVGQKLWFRAPSFRNGIQDTVEVEVLGVNPERFRLPSGQVTFMRPGLPVFPSELILVDQTLDLSLRATVARPSLRLGYFTSGMSWNASYDVVLDKARARVVGKAVITNNALRVRDAEIQLLAGNVGRRSDGNRLEEMVVVSRVAAAAPAEAAKEEGIGEAHLYSLPGRLTLENAVTTTATLFEPSTAPWEKGYVVRGQLNYYGPLPQYGNDESQVPVEVWYTLKRQAKTVFGDLPLPMGSYRLYEPDDAGRLQLIGEASAGHVAPGTDVRLAAGNAFDLTATRVQMSYSARRDSLRTIATADYRVTIKSAKDSAATVDVLEERGGEWSVLSSSVPPEKLSSTRTRFRVRVPGKGEVTLTYRVRVVW